MALNLLRLLSLALLVPRVETVEIAVGTSSEDAIEMDTLNFDDVADVKFDAEPMEDGLPPKEWNLREHRRTVTQNFPKYKKLSKLYMIERILEADEASKIASTVGDLDFSKSPDPIDGLPSHMLRLNAAKHQEETTKKLQDLVMPIVHTRLLPLIRHRYECKNCTVCNIAFRRYAAGELGQRASIQTHYDDAYFASAEIGLDVQGLEYDGGLYVEDNGERKVVPLKTGDALYHQYDLPHGVDVQEGRRTSLLVQFQDSLDCMPDHAKWYLRAAKKGDPVAKFQLGQLFQVGTKSTQKDLMKALRLFEAANEKGYQKAAVAMAQMLLNMETTAEIPMDVELAVKVLKAASKDGNSDAAYLLAQHLLLTPEADHAEAVTLLKWAAEPPRLHHHSAYMLGNLHVGENGAVGMDMQKAVSWWRVAGQHGFPPAMGNVGAFHLNEVLEGIEQKEDVASKAKEARKWLHPAAMSGYGPAMYSLGVLDLKYAKDVPSALQWLEKAKEAGHEQAKIEFDAVRDLRNSAEQKRARTRAAQMYV